VIPESLTSALPNHLWQSTLFAAAAGLITLALRRNNARARHWLWLIASLKFLIPFSLLVGLGGSLGWSNATRLAASPGFSRTVEEIGLPFTVPAVTAAASAHRDVSSPWAGNAFPTVLCALWACGFATVALAGFVRWSRVRAAARAASPLPLQSEVTVVSSATMLEPGVFGIWRPVLILPEGIRDRLQPAELKAILAHEMCHVRRRDNLAAALHMAVEAIFWFHPLVWWIGARMVEERERACDEEVVRLGSEPYIYAESILKICQFYLGSPVMCVSGITGANLKKRIVRIMSQKVTNNLGAGRKLLLAAAGIMAVAGPILFGLINTPAGRAQSAARELGATISPLPTFEVASVKPNKSGDMGVQLMFQPGGRFNAKNISLKFLIRFAYGVQDFQITGGPAWLNSDKYDIEAKAEGRSKTEMDNMTDAQRDADMEQNKLRMQALLADRFKLTLHKESKDAPIYALVVAKNGPKLKEATPEELAPPDPNEAPKPPGPNGKMRGRGMRMGRGELTGQAAQMTFLADVLSNQVGRTVIDKTGLTGLYDFTLKWTPDESQGPMFKGPGDAPPPPDPNGPSLFTAIQEQLGLKLEPQRGPVDLLVIDHAEKASEN
jgi:bla regulator protein BlaR1